MRYGLRFEPVYIAIIVAVGIDYIYLYIIVAVDIDYSIKYYLWTVI